MLTDFVPLFSVVIGGLLTVLGGLVTNYMTQSGSRKAEKRKAYRDKLEEIYSLSNQVMSWVDWHYGLKDGAKDEAPACPIDRVVLIARLYLPDLKEQAIDFEKTFTEYKMCTPSNDPLHLPNDPFYRIRTKYERLLSVIENTARKEVQ